MNSKPKQFPSKYSRAFEWRVAKGDVPFTAHLKGLGALAASENRDILLDYYEISRKRRTDRTALFKLQSHLFEDLLDLENGNKLWKMKVEDIKGTMVSSGTSANNEELEEAEGQLFGHRLYANVIRLIVDGIVWRAFNYDRAALNVLSRASTKQHLSATGTAQEIREWAHHYSDSTVAIAVLNSLSNWLALGDVTVIKTDGSAEILEVKSGKSTSRRMQRQKHRMSEAVTLLGGGPGEFDGTPIKFTRIEGCPEHGLSELGKLLQEAQKKGWAMARLSNCLFVECVDFVALDVSGPQWQKEFEEKRAGAISYWYKQGDFVVEGESHELLTFSPNCAPLSIFPFSSATCMDLMLGTKAYRSYLNVSAIGREFEYRGWRILKTPQDFHDEGVLHRRLFQFEKYGSALTLSTTSLRRIQMEMVRPQTLIRESEAIRYAGPSAFPVGTGQSFVFESEGSMWD